MRTGEENDEEGEMQLGDTCVCAVPVAQARVRPVDRWTGRAARYARRCSTAPPDLQDPLMTRKPPPQNLEDGTR